MTAPKKNTITELDKAGPSSKQEGRLRSLLDFLASVNDQHFTGYIKVNFNQGNICKVEKYEEILRKS
ncbi:MAG: hypothetical protein KKG47_09490 [Proteobacteria bacterium]|nr:hypothetical protein [Pseudomonadota bacterium]MBU1736850.1 hypothetical protein [Pseudomonadota bacterium]